MSSEIRKSMENWNQRKQFLKHLKNLISKYQKKIDGIKDETKTDTMTDEYVDEEGNDEELFQQV